MARNAPTDRAPRRDRRDMSVKWRERRRCYYTLPEGAWTGIPLPAQVVGREVALSAAQGRVVAAAGRVGLIIPLPGTQGHGLKICGYDEPAVPIIDAYDEKPRVRHRAFRKQIAMPRGTPKGTRHRSAPLVPAEFVAQSNSAIISYTSVEDTGVMPAGVSAFPSSCR